MAQAWMATSLDKAPVQDGWLGEFADDQLTALVTEALGANPTLEQAEGRLKRARAILRQSEAARMPSLIAGASSSFAGGLDGRSDKSFYRVDLTASWEADLWGRLANDEDASRYQVLAREADLSSVQQLIGASTARAYFLLIEARRLADVERANLVSLEETLGFVSIQFERGLRSSEDLALIRADVETACASLDLAEQAERDAARAIEILLGRYPEADLALAGDFPVRPSQQTIGQPAALLERRPDIFAAKFTILTEHARTESVRADLLPRLTMTGVFDGTTNRLQDLFDPTALAASFVLSTSHVVFDGGARQGRIKAADANREIAIGAYKELVLSAFNEVESELDRGFVLERREAHLSSALGEARDALQFSKFRYELGESDLLNVLSIQQRVTFLEAQLARVQRARLDQHVALALALGRTVL